MEAAEMVFNAQVGASREKVWSVLLEGYPQWIAAFCGDGARVVGEWKADAEMEFHAPSGKGGMVARVVEYDINRRVKWQYIAVICDGKRADFGEKMAAMRGCHESFSLSDEDGGTALKVDVTAPAAHRDFISTKWPEAMTKIKTLAEAA